MRSSSKTSLRDVLSKPASSGSLEIIAGIALALWVFGRVVFGRSFLAGQEWVVASSMLSVFDAVAVGCLVAVLAGRGFDFKPTGVMTLFGLLLLVIFVWSKTGDTRLAVLALFLVATSGMDLRRLIRFGACAIFAGLAVSLCLSLVLLSGDPGFAVGDALSGELSFGHPRVVANLLLGALMAIAVSSVRGSLVRKALIFACVVCAIASFVLLRAPRVAFILVLLALCVMADERSLWAKVSWLNRREMRWLVAALPIVLFCIVNDAPAFLQLTFDRSAYTGFVPLFGYASLFCFGVLYVRAVLLWPEDDWLFIVFASFVLCSLWFMCEIEPMYLEFNLTLILLSAGVRRGVLDGEDDEKGSCG